MNNSKKTLPRTILNKIKDLSMLGSTNETIANVLGISISTYYNWLNEYPEINYTILLNEIEDSKILKSMIKIAKGYTTTEKIYNGDGELIEKKIKKLPPNINACKYILKVRRKNELNNWNEVEKTENVNINHNTDSEKESIKNWMKAQGIRGEQLLKMTNEELKKKYQEYKGNAQVS